MNRNSIYFLLGSFVFILLIGLSLFLPVKTQKLVKRGKLDLSNVEWAKKRPEQVNDQVILYFFASWCVTCRNHYQQIYRAILDKDNITWIGVLYFDKLADAQSAYPLLFEVMDGYIEDPKGKLAVGYGVLGTPEFLRFEKNELVAHTYRLESLW